jgi:hypothetical protein
MTLKIYPASSWRNAHYPTVIAALRADGHDVYDFREANSGFCWSCSTLQEYITQLQSDPLVAAAFKRDRDALDWCDVCVLVLPSGRSSHLEVAYAAGCGKSTIVMLSEAEPLRGKEELMYKLLALGTGGVKFVTTIGELLAALRNCAIVKTTDETRKLAEHALDPL